MSAHEARGPGIRICIDCMLLCMEKGGGRAGKRRGLGRAGVRTREACRQVRGKRRPVGRARRRARRHAELRTAPECQVRALAVVLGHDPKMEVAQVWRAARIGET